MRGLRVEGKRAPSDLRDGGLLISGVSIPGELFRLLVMKAVMLGLFVVAGLASVWGGEARAASASRQPPATITYVGAQGTKTGSRAFRFRVTNASNAPLFFDGYSNTSPLYSVQFHRLGLFWRPIPKGWCGTGLETRRLAAGESFSFLVANPHTIWPWAAGFSFRHRSDPQDEGFMVWSNTVN